MFWRVCKAAELDVQRQNGDPIAPSRDHMPRRGQQIERQSRRNRPNCEVGPARTRRMIPSMAAGNTGDAARLKSVAMDTFAATVAATSRTRAPPGPCRPLAASRTGARIKNNQSASTRTRVH